VHAAQTDLKHTQLLTRSRLKETFDEVGIQAGDIVCVHASMSRLGYVCGGARAIIEALDAAVGPQGTVMMPAYTRDTADPREWRYPPAPDAWLTALLDETPAYDPQLSPPQNVGAVAELFRTYPGVARSGHPISSVAARGPRAEALTAGVPLDNRFGPDSPYGRLVRFDGKVLMLGAPYETMSLLHLSQYLIGWSTPAVKSACMLVDGKRQWVQFRDVLFPHDWAAQCVDDMVRQGIAERKPCGESYVLAVRAKNAVDFSLGWRKQNNC
jgi:aminoglycoside 3-N-acetyltransferase